MNPTVSQPVYICTTKEGITQFLQNAIAYLLTKENLMQKVLPKFLDEMKEFARTVQNFINENNNNITFA